MSSQANPFSVGQKVTLLLRTGQVSTKRFEIVKIWRYPSTFRYQLDTGYVADHAELRATEDPADRPAGGESEPVAPAPDVDA